MRAGSKPGVRGAGGIGVDAGMESWDSLPPPAICPFRTSTASGSLLAVAHDVHLDLSCARPRCIYHSTSLSHADPCFRALISPAFLVFRCSCSPCAQPVRQLQVSDLTAPSTPTTAPRRASREHCRDGDPVECHRTSLGRAPASRVLTITQELPGCALLRRCPVFLPSLVHPRARKLRLRAASPSRSASRPSTCVGIGLLCLMLADPA